MCAGLLGYERSAQLVDTVDQLRVGLDEVEVDERGVRLASRVRTGLRATNLLHLSKGLDRSPGSRL